MTTFGHFRIQSLQVFTFLALVTGIAVSPALGQQLEPVAPTQPATTPDAEISEKSAETGTESAGGEEAAGGQEDAGKALLLCRIPR